MKRHIAIPLLCVVLVAALSFPVFATSSNFPYPDNDVSGTYDITFKYGNYNGTTSSWSGSKNFGTLWTGIVIDETDIQMSTSTVEGDFVLNVTVGGPMYIAVSNAYTPYAASDNLSAYRDSTNDYSVDLGDNWTVDRYIPNGTSFTIESTTASLDILFLAYKNVPAGTYYFNYDVDSLNVGLGEAACFGVYASKGDEYESIIDCVITGSTSYTDAIDQIMDVYESTQSPDVDIHQRTINAIELTNTLEQLNMSMSSLAAQNASALSSKMGSTVDQFANGEINLSNAMNSLSSDFTSALSGAQTVDEAQAVTAVYKSKLIELELESEFQLMEGFDAVITDEQIQNANDYYAAESELVNAFDLADLEAQFQYELWWNQMPKNETIEYKKFFDYLLNESDIRFFITIPLALSLVTIIMGTRMRTKPDSDSNSGSDVSHVWFSDGSAYHHND